MLCVCVCMHILEYVFCIIIGFVDEDNSTSRAGKAGPSFTTEIKATLNTSVSPTRLEKHPQNPCPFDLH